MYDKIKPSKKRVKKNVAALTSLIGTEESSMTKRKFRLKPLVISAAVVIVSTVSLFTVNAATKGAIVKFVMGGEEIEGEYYDYVDKDGFRQVSFAAVVPIYEDTYAAIYDVDAPQGENVRVLTPETDPEFFENLRRYMEERAKTWEEIGVMWDKIRAWKGEIEKNGDAMDAAKQEAIEAGIIDPSEIPELPEPEDYGFVFKDSEICLWSLDYIDEETNHHHMTDGCLGGNFMDTEAAEWKASGFGIHKEPNERHYDYENGTQTIKQTFYYYVGKEQD